MKKNSFYNILYLSSLISVLSILALSCSNNEMPGNESVSSIRDIRFDTTFYQVDFAIVSEDTIYKESISQSKFDRIFQINQDNLVILRYNQENDSVQLSKLIGAIWIPFNDSLMFSIVPKIYNLEDFRINVGYCESVLVNSKTHTIIPNAFVRIIQLKTDHNIADKVNERSKGLKFEKGQFEASENFSTSEFISLDSWKNN
jgi:hypothetical protein